MGGRLDAVLLDVDDTLVQTARTGHAKCVEVARRLGLQPPSAAEFAAVYGREPWPACARTWHPGLDDLDGYVALYDGLAARFPDRPCGDAPRLVARCRRLGLRVGVLTNGPERKTARKLRAAGLAPDALDGVWSREHLPHSKPDPRCFAPALAAWGLPPGRVRYVADAPGDWAAATAAGLQFRAVLTGLTGRAAWSCLLRGRCIVERLDDAV